jgi:hypothetical protein
MDGLFNKGKEMLSGNNNNNNSQQGGAAPQDGNAQQGGNAGQEDYGDKGKLPLQVSPFSHPTISSSLLADPL